jgi:hypothetical protein
MRRINMEIKYPNMGVCGLPCQLCAMYHMESKGRCAGCKSEARMKTGCPFIRCAVKEKGVDFCWECDESLTCEKWNARRARAGRVDSVKCCHQRLGEYISFIKENGVGEFKRVQDSREKILRDMLDNFNEGRSKSLYCVAATVMYIEELEEAVLKAKKESEGLEIKEKAKILHLLLDKIARQKNYTLKLRK